MQSKFDFIYDKKKRVFAVVFKAHIFLIHLSQKEKL